MLNLYLKIFLAFWLSTLLMVGSAFLISHYIPVDKSFNPGPPPIHIAREIRAQLRQGSNEKFQHWASGIHKRHKVDIYLFGKDDSPVFQVEASPFTAEQWPQFITELERRRHNSLVRDNRLFVTGSRGLRRSDIKRFVFSMPAPKGEFERLFIRHVGIRLAIAFVISGFICLVLARYFTVPIARLRKAMQKVAEGDYSVRTVAHASAGKDELRLLAEDFDRMTEKVKQSKDSQARLIQDVSHELRTPLARLQAALGLAQQKQAQRQDGLALDAELQRIEDEVQAIDELIEQILSLPQQNLQLSDAVDLVSLLQHCISNTEQLHSGKQLAFKFHPDLDEAVVATRGRLLDSVFENVLNNAARYAPQNSSVDISLQQTDGSFCIFIRDQGPGVADEHVDQLFHPFYRTSEARERDSGGYGLGLAIAQRNVLLHHGEIKARNLCDPQGQRCGFELSIRLPALQG